MNDNDLFVVEIWRAVRTRPIVVLGVTLVCGLLAAFAAFKMTPFYRASVLVAPVVEQGGKSSLGGLLNQFGGLASMAGVSLGGSTSEAEAIAILTSRDFTTRFVQENNLLPVLFEGRWDASRNTWLVDQEAPDLADGYRALSGITNVAVDRQTGFVTLSIDWIDPELAAIWANQLVKKANEVMRAKAIEDAERSVEYLERELEKTSMVEIRQAIYSLIEAQVRRTMLANVRDEYAFRVLDKAVAAKADEFVRPRRVLMVALGLVIGAVSGIGLALILYVRQRRRTA